MNPMEQLMEKTKLSRRNFLQMAGALSATATLYGCSGGGNGSQGVVTAQDNLVFDKSLKTVMVGHPYNCGGRCMLKIHVKNGKMVKITSGIADIPRAGSTAADESIDQPQFRACIKGYGMVKRVYQPDRLKYPMKQTKLRGDLSGFVRISWDEAYTTIASQYQTVIARKAALGYIPALGGVFNYFGIAVTTSGSPSTDNFQQGMYGGIGKRNTIFSNGLPDMLNSKFILNFGCNAAVSFSHQYPIYWYLTKAKEMGIPIVTLDPTCTDTATTLSTGYAKYNLPAYLNPRMNSDTAIMAAMANVIYRKNLHDVSFIQTYCFGFFKGDTVVSQSSFKDPVTGVAASGQTFTTPTGMSFVEYLDDLEAKNGGYNGVLAWAAQISGISATIIENLGIAYGSTKYSCLFSGWGANRSGNAMHFSMMGIALAGMTGQSNKSGGAPGFIDYSEPTPVSLGATKEVVSTAATFGTINLSTIAISKIILQGTDNRTYAQLRADILKQNSIDLGAFKAVRDDVNGNDGRMRVEFICVGPSSNKFNQASGPIGKYREALKKVKFMYGMDHFMTPSLAHSDIVLPQTCHLEYDSWQSKPQVYYFSNKVIEPMYECKDSGEINAEILKKLGVNYGKYGPQGSKTARTLMAEQWAGAKIDPLLLAITPNATLPSFEDFSASGVFQLPIPAAKAPLNLGVTVAPGKYPTETGRINFFSPFYFNRDKTIAGAVPRADGGYYRSFFPPKAMYAPYFEGFDQVTGAYLGGYTGNKIKNGVNLRYTLQLSTAHQRRRAHSAYDNVAIIKENFPNPCEMNTADAAARGINDGDYVYVYNDWGCSKVKVTVSRRISKGAIHIGDGEWYRASLSETYDAWYDMDGSGPVKVTVPVDVGGAPNTLTNDRDSGVKDSFCGTAGDNTFNGHFVEVSLTHPDK